MTNFTDEHVEIFKKGGNRIAAQIWRAKWNESTDPRPKPNDERLHKFIENTYVKKRWYDAKGEIAPIEPITKIIKQPEKISFDTGDDWGQEETPVKKQEVIQSKPKQTPSLFDEAPVQHAPSKPKQSSFFDEPQQGKSKDEDFFGQSGGFDAQFDEPDQFGSQKKKNLSLDDLFGSSGPQQPQQMSTHGFFGQSQQQPQQQTQQQWFSQPQQQFYQQPQVYHTQQQYSQQQYPPQQQYMQQQFVPQQQYHQHVPQQQYVQQVQQPTKPQVNPLLAHQPQPQSNDPFASLWQSSTQNPPKQQQTKPQEKSLFDF